MSDNLYLVANQKKYRFNSSKGALTVENLFDLPLSSKTGFDLDSVARAVNSELKAVSEESFVTTKNAGASDLFNKLEIVKDVIRLKQEAANKASEAAFKASRRRQIMDAIAAQDEKALTTASRDQLLAELAKLDD